MNFSRTFSGATITAICFGFIFSQAELVAVEPQQIAKPKKTAHILVVDVALTTGGKLAGLVVDDRGVGLDGAIVSIRQGQNEVARTVVNKDGVFVVDNLRAGVYRIVAGRGSGLFRLWSPNTAPPKARMQALIVSTNQFVRGQFGPGLGGDLTMVELIDLGFTITSVTLISVALDKVSDLEDDVAFLKSKSP